MSYKNFTRKDLSNKIYQKLGFSKNMSSKIIDDFFEFLVSELVKLNKIKITSFGTFQVINKKEMLYNLKENVINPHFIAYSKLEL